VFADAAAALARLSSPPSEMLAWLYTIAQRRFLDEPRRRRRGVWGAFIRFCGLSSPTRG
jgi:DNA-directed RNA polymerase specialized sigma24 family protein